MSVFISYRRDGGEQIAKSVFQYLYEEYNTFLDTESLKNGRFAPIIEKRIVECSDFIMVVTENIFDRCAEPYDWIFHEAQIALRENKNIIPIFVGIRKFPSNVPELLKKICDYNGIFWADKDVTCAKVKSFLVSNRRYKLTVTKSGNRIVLSQATQEELKELYRRFLKNGRTPTDVKIYIPEPVELSKLIIRQDIVKDHGADFAAYFAEQSLLSKIGRVKETLETAIEYLLQDEMIDYCATKLRERYMKKHGAVNCIFRDEKGMELFYWTPFLWIDIIEELLKELLLDRYSVYLNSKDFTAIDCVVETRNREKIWWFTSFISKLFEDEPYSQFMNIINMSGGRGDYMDIPLYSLAFHVYPDLYYNIGLLKTNKTLRSFEKVDQYKGIFDLRHYCIGLH